MERLERKTVLLASSKRSRFVICSNVVQQNKISSFSSKVERKANFGYAPAGYWLPLLEGGLERNFPIHEAALEEKRKRFEAARGYSD